MVAAEISAAITSLRTTLDIAKMMVGLRDAEAFRAKSIELQETILQALNSGIEAREAYAKQLDQVRELETEIARLKACIAKRDAETIEYRGYRYRKNASGKPSGRAYCPVCEAKDALFIQTTPGNEAGRPLVCPNCKGKFFDVSSFGYDE
jgi:hypothetical protein